MDGNNNFKLQIQVMNSLANEIIGYVILFGILVSYIPQFVKIIKNKSSNGISEIYLIIGYISAITSWNNGFLFYYPVWESCKGFYQCNDETLGFIQLFVQFLCMGIFYILYLKFYDTKIEPVSWLFFVGSQLFLILIFVITYLLSTKEFNNMVIIKRYGYFLSVITIIATCIQYLPQIYKTFKLKHPKSLSLVMLSIQCPGTFAWAIYLALQKGEDISTWIPFIVAASSQLILIILGIYYKKFYNGGYQPILIN